MKVLLYAMSVSAILSSQMVLAKTKTDCKPIAEKAILFLLSLNGHSVEYCGKDVYAPQSGCLHISGGPVDHGHAVYGGQYTYGGAYYNVDDYTVRMYGGDCEIQEITVRGN
jgi:hypothetical protein